MSRLLNRWSLSLLQARLDTLGKAFPGERIVIPAGQPKVRNNDCDYAFRPDTTFSYYTGLGEDYEAGAVLVLNPVDPDSPEAAAGKTHVPELFVAPRANHYTQDFFMDAHYGEYWVGPRAGLQEMTAMTGIETNDIAQLADALSKDVGSGSWCRACASDSRGRSADHRNGGEYSRGERASPIRMATPAPMTSFMSSPPSLACARDEYEIREMRKAGCRNQAWFRQHSAQAAVVARQASFGTYAGRRVQCHFP